MKYANRHSAETPDAPACCRFATTVCSLAGELIAVETLELPASATRLDNVLRVRSPAGQEYLHIVEWQGYRDPALLWQLTSYIAWLGQYTPDVAITGTVVYLTPESDTGDRLIQIID